MLSNVLFTDVASLPFDSPDGKQSYGDDPFHVVEYWSQPDAIDTVLFIHGGCWLSDFDASHARPLCAAINKLGYTVWSLEYRRIGNEGGGWPGTFADVMAGLRHVHQAHRARENAGRLILAGHSAGGHLALWAATCISCQEEPKDAPKIDLTIGLAAISDIHQYATGSSPCEKATISLMGGSPETQPQRYAEGSPLTLAAKSRTDNIRLLHGAKDQIVSIEQSRHLASQSEAQLVELSEAAHFDLIHPDSIAFPKLVQLLSSP